MSKIEIFDPAMCCSTGVCGPSVDPDLTRLAAAVYSLEQKNFDITRYNLANDPAAFVDNKTINEILNEKGPDALPVTLINNEVVKVGEYPTNEELSHWLGIKPDELTQKPRISIELK